MTKLWRLLTASTVLSGLAGVGAAHAATDLALRKSDDKTQASIILAQAQPAQAQPAPAPAAEDNRRRQGNPQGQNKPQGQNQPQGQNKPQGQTTQQGQNKPQGQPTQQGQNKPPAQNQPPAQTQQQGQNKQQDQKQQGQNRQQGQNKQQGQNQPQGQGAQPNQPRPAATQASPPPPPARAAAPPANKPPEGNAGRNTPPPAATNDRGGQNRNAGGNNQNQNNQNQGRNRDANQNQNQGRDRNANPNQGSDRNNRNQATTPRPGDNNRGNAANQADDKNKPIQSSGAGKGVAVKSASGQDIRKVDDLKSERKVTKEGNRTVINEPGRTIIKDGNNKTIIRHDESLRFRLGATDVRVERVGNDSRTIIFRPGGVRIVTVTDRNGLLLRRVRILPNGREIVLINNRPRVAGFFVVLPPPRILIPQDRYIVAYRAAPPALIYETLMAPPVEVIERPYTLDEIRYSAPVRDRMPRIDLDDITFETGSWELTQESIDKLANIAEGMKRVIDQYPAAMFLIEGHTDAVGDDDDNLSLSDRRAESVAVALTEQFQVPAENLTTQGYGEQQLKVPTDGPEEQNRRVTVRNIAPLLAGKAEATSGESVPQ